MTMHQIDIRPATMPREQPRRHAHGSSALVLVTMCLGVFLAQLDTSVVNLALSRIGAELGSSVAQLQWVVDGYNLTYACCLLTGGTLGDNFGRRRVFMTGIVFFAAGSLLCGVAPEHASLIGGRMLAGLGAALQIPVSLTILSDTYADAEQRARAIGTWAGCNGLAWVIGPALGGAIVGHVGWRWIFLVAVPVGMLAIGLSLAYVPKSPRQGGRGIDASGQLLAVSMLGSLSIAFIEGPRWGWSHVATIVCLATAACACACFLTVEWRSPQPLLPLTIFRSRAFTAAALAAAAMTFGMYALLFLMPLYLQVVRGASAPTVGLQMLPLSLAFFLVSLRSGALAARFGARAVMTSGLALMGSGFLILAALSRGADIALIEVAFLQIGIGLGLNTGPLLSVGLAAAPKRNTGAAAGVVNTARMVGATLGVAVLGGFFAAQAGQGPIDPLRIAEGLQPALIGGAASEFFGALLAWYWIPTTALRSRRRANGTFTVSTRTRGRA
jgi:MFS transporter, DHA2 family, methylenomycin A resistance protein